MDPGITRVLVVTNVLLIPADDGLSALNRDRIFLCDPRSLRASDGDFRQRKCRRRPSLPMKEKCDHAGMIVRRLCVADFLLASRKQRQ